MSPAAGQSFRGATTGILRYWDVATGKQVRRIHLDRVDEISALAVAAAGKSVVAAAEGNDVLGLWDITTGREIRRVATGHGDTIRPLAFAPDGKRAVSAGADGSVRLWDTATLRLLDRFSASREPILSVAFSPDCRTIALGGADAVLRLWKPGVGEIQRSQARDDPDNHIIASVAYSPDGNRVAWGGIDGVVKTWDARVGREIGQFQGHQGGIHQLVFSGDSRSLASASGDGTILIWDVANIPGDIPDAAKPGVDKGDIPED